MIQGTTQGGCKKGNQENHKLGQLMAKMAMSTQTVQMATFSIFSQGQTDETRQFCKEFEVLQ